MLATPQSTRLVGCLVHGLCGWAILSGLGGCDQRAAVGVPAGPKVEQLVVVTPHNEIIRSVFEDAFSDWHHDKHGSYVEIHWIAAGTPQCLEYVREAGQPAFVRAERAIPDVLFGGGPLEHQEVADQGLSRPVDLSEIETDLPGEIRGMATRGAGNRWHSSALSSFGVLVASRACRQRGIAEPTTWQDLADPRFHGWLAVADPQRSGSNLHCFITVLQKYGWDQGWGILMRILANCRALSGSSADVISNVTSGMCLAGFTVNFSALHEVEQHAPGVLAFVAPSDAIAVTPDPVSVLTYAQNHVVGERFARFCVSDAGQRIWGFKAEQRGGHNDTLFRYPIHPKFYREHRNELSVADNPFDLDSVLVLDPETTKKQSGIIVPLVQAACGDNHILLQRCWRKIIDSGLSEAALAELLQPVVSESEAYRELDEYRKGNAEAAALVARWSERFREKYRRVEEAIDASG